MAPMRTVEEHARIIASLLSPTSAEPRALADSLGLVLARDVVATIDLPPFANSAMDGYAVRFSDVADPPVTLQVSQDIPAGRADIQPLAPGTAARIMTGAPVPEGAEMVIPVELTDAGVDLVRIDSTIAPRTHIRGRGEDVAAGATALPAGTVVGPTQIGVAAALGQPELIVRRPLRVLVLATGSELVAPGTPLGPGQIYESNATMLAAAFRALGAEPRVEQFVADDVRELRAALHGAALHSAAGDTDLIITSGGVSAGAYEVVKEAFAGRGVDFAKVAMQPGMPQGAGRFEGIPLVALPGNPVSAFISFEVFLRPAVRAAMGHSDITRPVVTLPLTAPLDSPPNKRQFRRGLLNAVDGTVRAWGGPGSHLLSWLAGADCMIVVPETVTHLDVGEQVEVWLLS